MAHIKIIKIVFLSIALMAWGVESAMAADLFVKPKSKQPVQEKPADPILPEKGQDDALLKLLDKAPPVQAPEAVPQTINEFANAYYKNCMNKQHPVLDSENLQTLCACTAAKIPGVMSVKDMRAMQNDDDEGRLQRSRMLLFVYTPCIEYPTRALIINQCLNTPDVQNTIKNYQRVCTCLGDGMAQFMREKAPKYVEVALNRNPDTLDPLGMLMKSKAYEQESRYYLQRCIQKHVYGQ
ncbi:MAG: hypothetical protein H6859_03930 [Rhodospirillales bacterium]|nr:MAG: hypothetical protein H6859_03930 [Rhodospirillales bacterium]